MDVSVAKIGHNNPPTLAEELAAEVADYTKRKNELVEAANKAAIKDPDTQKLTTALANLIRAHRETVELARKARKKPFDDGALAVQRAYNPILHPLDEALGSLRKLNDAYEADLERAREAERRRLAAEEAERLREAEEAKARAEAAQKSGGSSLSDELAAAQAQEAAELAAQRRQGIHATPVRTDIGSATLATATTYRIDNLKGCLTYLQRAQKAALIEAIQPIINRLGRAKVAIPGVTVVTTKQTRFGR